MTFKKKKNKTHHLKTAFTSLNINSDVFINHIWNIRLSGGGSGDRVEGRVMGTSVTVCDDRF